MHPVDTLEEEHRVIQSVLGAMEREAESLQGDGPVRTRFWLGVSEFLEKFADGCHHAKEEDLLFPALAECGIPEEGGPIGVMKDEHVQGRRLRQRIHAAATDGDGSSLLAASRGFVFLLREHIHKEETVLFQMARHALGAEKTAELEEAFAGKDPGSEYVSLAARLSTPA
jgi:hemerythrin-like domain-containing protein